ncbi:MAG: hypothetical protein ACXVAN_09325 [Polyangia bacterium]
MDAGRHGRIIRRLRWMLVVLALVKGWVWVGLTPPFKSFDEPAHFDHVQYRAEHFAAPRPTGAPMDKVMNAGASPELQYAWEVTLRYFRDKYLPGVRSVPEEGELAAMARHRDARLGDGQMPAMSYPAPYYLLGVVAYLPLRQASVVARLYAVRCLSVLFGLLAVLCTFAAARCVLDDPWLAFAAAAIVALQPVASQQTATVNNDAAVFGVGALVFWLQARVLAGWPAPPSPRLAALLGAATRLVLLTKPQAVALVPASAVVLAIAAWPTLRERATWRRLGVALGAFVVPAVPAVFALRRSLSAFSTLNSQQLVASGPVHEHFLVWMVREKRLHTALFRGLWGKLGWGDFGLEPFWFDLIHGAATLVGCALVAAMLLRALRLGRRWWSWRGLALCAATVVATTVFVFYAEYHARAHLGVVGATQGRNLLYGLPALAIVVVLALGALVPARLRAAVAALVIAGAGAMQLGALATVARFYHGH